MRFLMIIAKRGTKTRSPYLLHVDKGYEVFTVNAFKENENDPYCGRDNSKIFQILPLYSYCLDSTC